MPDDLRDLTIRDLCRMAEDLRTVPPRSEQRDRAIHALAAASVYLQGSRALQYMLHFARKVKAEAPPPERGKVIELPPPGWR